MPPILCAKKAGLSRLLNSCLHLPESEWKECISLKKTGWQHDLDMKQTGLKTGMILNIMTDGSSFQDFRQI